MSGTEVVTCGVDGHDDTCLCDVQVGASAPTVTSLVDNWLLSMVANYFDLSLPWTPTKLAFLLEKSSVFLEEYYRVQGQASAMEVANVPPRINEGREGARETFPQYVKRTKEAIAEVARRLGDECLPSQVAELCQIDHTTMVELLSMKRNDPSLIPPDCYDTVVLELRAGLLSNRAIAQRHGLNRDPRSGTIPWLKETFITQFQ